MLGRTSTPFYRQKRNVDSTLMYFLFKFSKCQCNSRRLILSFNWRCLHQQSHAESGH